MYLFVSVSWLVSFGVCIYIQYFLMHKCLLELIKRRSKVQENNTSCKRALNFDRWKTFSVNYKPIRVWLWFVYKFTESNCRLRLSTEFIQTQKRYPTSLEKISILAWKLYHIKPKFFLWTKLPKNLLLPKYLISVVATLKEYIKYWKRSMNDTIYIVKIGTVN